MRSQARTPKISLVFSSILIPWFCLSAGFGTKNAYATDGLDAYRQGNYIVAAERFKDVSNKDPIVDFYIGQMRLYGYGQLKNNQLALRYFQYAAEKGFLPAQQILARYALIEENNPEKALIWFKKAAAANDLQAQMYCAAAYRFGVGVKKNSDSARRYYIDAARNGDSTAQYALAENFMESRQVASKKLGLIWLNKAVAGNNPEAQLKLAEFYTQGGLVAKDLVKAKELLNLSIAAGYVKAYYKMGEILQQQNDAKGALVWYQKAADGHYNPAEIAISTLYTQEKSPLYNVKEGFVLMLKAAQNGSSEAQFALASLYKTGQGVEKNESLANEWHSMAEKTAKSSLVSPEISAAMWLSHGKSTTFAGTTYQLKGIFSDWSNPDALKENNYNPAPKMHVLTRDTLYKPTFVMTNPNDISISEFYDALATSLSDSSLKEEASFPRYPLDITLAPLKESKNQATVDELKGRAALGDSTAQFSLGQLYQAGIGVNKNAEEAVKYYEQASNQQDLRAEYNLAMIYLEGDGISADYVKASELLRDAAFKGNDFAQFVIGRTNEQGYRNKAGEVVISPNAEQAMVMYDLAAANDYGPAQYRLAEMIVREKKDDMSVATSEKRNLTIKQLYQHAFSAGVLEAALPLAFFNAVDTDKTKQGQAFTVAEKEALTGKAGAALLLGLLYDRGIGVDVNQKEALHWYRQASLKTPVGAFILGTYESQGIGIAKDEQQGRILLQQAAEAGFPYANLNLAVMKQQSGEAFIPDLDKALAAGNSTAGLLLADYYLSKANDAKQMQQAHDIYQNFAQKGDKDGQLKLGFMLEKGLGGPVDVAEAAKWYGLSAAQGQVVAQYLLGNLYQLGRLDKEPDYALAKKWYSSAQGSYAPAAVALGFIYDTVDADYQHALTSYQQAADKHSPIGDFDLGLIYEKGKGYPVDFVKALALYQEAAEKGYSRAMVQLAGLYFNGQVGARDEQKALYWYEKAAALGNRDALYQLGLLSETGVSTKLDFTNAVHYYQQAADKGNAKAMLALARIYQYGLGVDKDLKQAVTFYKALADLGNSFAEYQLATIYYEGIDGQRMPEKGKQLLQEAEENGSPQALRTLQWLSAQLEIRSSFIEPLLMNQTAVVSERPVDLMYLDALNDWNRGDELSSRMILDKIMIQFPHYIPAKRAYEQLNQQFNLQTIVS